MHNRQTLAGPVSIEGIGLHSGKTVRMRLLPAEPRSGIVFLRTDTGGPEIPAILRYSGPSFYATSLQRDGVTISTIEHLMAALYALLIDDLRVELDGPEVPILDGSSKPFVDALLRSGRVETDAPREYMTLVRPIVVSHEQKRIAAYPSREYRVTYAIEFEHPMLDYQELSAHRLAESSW